MERSRHADFSEAIRCSLCTSSRTLQGTHRCLEVSLTRIILPRSTAFCESSHAPDRICPGCRGFLGHQTLILNLGKSRANSHNWSPNLLGSTEQWVKGLQSPVPALVPTNNTASLFLSFLHIRLCLHFLFKGKSSVAEKGFEKHCSSLHSLDGPCQPKPRTFRDSAFSGKSNKKDSISVGRESGNRAKAAWMSSRDERCWHSRRGWLGSWLHPSPLLFQSASASKRRS